LPSPVRFSFFCDGPIERDARCIRIDHHLQETSHGPNNQNTNNGSEGSRSTDGKPLIESDRVEGTTVYDPRGNEIGSIKRLMIDKLSGRVAYAVMAFGGFLGMGAEEHAVPWVS
jgi:hypothetical protein